LQCRAIFKLKELVAQPEFGEESMSTLRKPVLLRFVVLLCAAWSCCFVLNLPHAPQTQDFAIPGQSPVRRQVQGVRDRHRVALHAAAAADAENDSVEVAGFSGFVVGLALLPHVIYTLVVAYDVTVNGSNFALGPYGLELIACTTTIGLTLWSFGSFVQRGRGLPAGPIGLLGLAEGFSYLGVLALAIAAVATSVRTGGTAVKAPETKAPVVSVPSVKAPDIKAPQVKVPDFKAPDIKVPEFKAPKLPEFQAPKFNVPEFQAPKVPEFKAPEFKVPAIKVPEVKMPEIKAPKLPEVKVPEVKVPEVKVPEVKVPQVKAPEPAKPKPEVKAPPAAPKASAPVQDYDDLFS